MMQRENNERKWEVMRTYFLLDLDCFFASVEMARQPALRGLPVCIGGPRDARGIVACPNYEARRYGVRTAMPLRTAARLLPPSAVFLPGNHALYGEYSRNVMGILRDFTPDVEQVSVDEAYMDVTGCLHFWGHNPERMARAVKERIVQRCGLGVSIGIAANKVCAKIAAGVQKPDGLVIVPRGTEREFLAPLPVEVIPGVGVKTLPKLHACALRTVGDAMDRAARTGAAASHSPLDSLCAHIAACAIPSDEPLMVEEQVEKSISRDRTFSEDTDDAEKILATLYSLAERCCKTLRQDGLRASTVTVRIRFSDFTTPQRQSTLAAPTSNEEDIFAAAQRLLTLLLPPTALIRLVGIKVSGLKSLPAGEAGKQVGAAEGEQLSLDLPAGPGGSTRSVLLNGKTPQERTAGLPAERLDALHRRLDGLQSRFGDASIRWGILCAGGEREEE
jgi:DNA polymerase-4